MNDDKNEIEKLKKDIKIKRNIFLSINYLNLTLYYKLGELFILKLN